MSKVAKATNRAEGRLATTLSYDALEPGDKVVAGKEARAADTN